MSAAKQHRALARRLLSLRRRRADIDSIPESLLNKLSRVGYTYILRGYTGLYKIGTSINPKSRISDLRRMNPGPLDLVALINGGRNMEAELHRSFSHCRCHGEWFRLSDAELETIRAYGESFAHINRSDWRREESLREAINDAEWGAFKLVETAPLAGSPLPDLVDIPALRKINEGVRHAQTSLARPRQKKPKRRVSITQPRRKALVDALREAS